MADFPNFPKYAGITPIVDSGSAIVSRNEMFTVDLYGLSFSIMAIHDQKAEQIATETPSRQQVIIRINTWQGGDLTFKFKVGTIHGYPLHLAVHLDEHYNYNIWTYTFTQERP